MSQQRKELAGEILKMLFASVIATASACWAARGVLADYDRRISILEAQEQFSGQAVSQQLADIRGDLRDLRSAVMTDKR